jgi:hypothetical protein
VLSTYEADELRVEDGKESLGARKQADEVGCRSESESEVRELREGVGRERRKRLVGP